MLRTRLQNLRFVVQTVAYMRGGRQRKASRGEQEGGREGGRKNKSWTDRWRSGTLAFGTARPVSETRRFEPEGEEEQGRPEGEAGEEEGGLLPKICGPTGNTWTLLVTLRWMLQAYTGPPCRQRVCIYRMIQKHRIIFLSLWTETRSLSHLLLALLLREAPAGMWPPLCPSSFSSVPISPTFSFSSSFAVSFLPRVLFTSYPAIGISSASNYVSAKRIETKALLAADCTVG